MLANSLPHKPSDLRHPVILVFVLGAALRLLWIIIIPVDPISDAAAYETFATNIAMHGVYGWTPEEPGAYWAVGPAAIYAAGYLIFGIGHPLAVLVPNMISSMAIVLLLYDLGQRWFDRRTGHIAALIFALWPLAIQFTTVLASEIHFMALTLAALSAWDRSGLDRRGIIWLVLSGLFLGAATYVRPIALLIPAALAISTAIRTLRLPWTDILKAAIATALIFAAVAPWSARNERVFNEPVFMSTNFWANFWMGNNPETEGFYMPLPDATNGMSEIERSDYLKDLSLVYLKEEPSAFVLRTVWKSLRLHERETIGVSWNEGALLELVGPMGVTLAKLFSTGFWYLMLGAALTGIVLLARGNLGWRVIVSPAVWLWLYFTGVHAVIVVGDRYHMPAIPIIALLAAVAISRLTEPAIQRSPL